MLRVARRYRTRTRLRCGRESAACLARCGVGRLACSWFRQRLRWRSLVPEGQPGGRCRWCCCGSRRGFGRGVFAMRGRSCWICWRLRSGVGCRFVRRWSMRGVGRWARRRRGLRGRRRSSGGGRRSSRRSRGSFGSSRRRIWRRRWRFSSARGCTVRRRRRRFGRWRRVRGMRVRGVPWSMRLGLRPGCSWSRRCCWSRPRSVCWRRRWWREGSADAPPAAKASAMWVRSARRAGLWRGYRAADSFCLSRSQASGHGRLVRRRQALTGVRSARRAGLWRGYRAADSFCLSRSQASGHGRLWQDEDASESPPQASPEGSSGGTTPGGLACGGGGVPPPCDAADLGPQSAPVCTAGGPCAGERMGLQGEFQNGVPEVGVATGGWKRGRVGV